MAVWATAQTEDGKYRVLIREDQTAELCQSNGPIVVGRVPVYRMGAELTEMGYDPTT